MDAWLNEIRTRTKNKSFTFDAVKIFLMEAEEDEEY